MISSTRSLLGSDLLDLKMAIPEFQRRLTEELKKAETVAIEAFIAVELDKNEYWLLDIKDLHSTAIAPKKIAKIGMVSTSMLGVSSFRGKVYPLLDMMMVLKGSPSSASVESIVTVVHGKFENSIGLLWPILKGMIQKKEFICVEISADLKEKWVKNIYKDSSGTIWKELNIEEIVQSEMLSQLVQID